MSSAMNEREIVETYVPESVKEMVRTFQTHKLASSITGLDDFTIDKVAGYLGGRMVARRLRWRPVADGLMALRNLKG